MKKKIIIILIIIVLAGGSVAAYFIVDALNKPELKKTITTSTKTGKKEEKAPDFDLKTYNNKKVSLKEYEGKPLVILFSATWCPTCNDEAPIAEKTYKKYKNKVNFLSINVNDTASAIKSFVKKNKITYPMALDDDKTSKKYEVSGVPTHIFLDKDSIIVDKYVGGLGEKGFTEKVKRLL